MWDLSSAAPHTMQRLGGLSSMIERILSVLRLHVRISALQRFCFVVRKPVSEDLTALLISFLLKLRPRLWNFSVAENLMFL